MRTHTNPQAICNEIARLSEALKALFDRIAFIVDEGRSSPNYVDTLIALDEMGYAIRAMRKVFAPGLRNDMGETFYLVHAGPSRDLKANLMWAGIDGQHRSPEAIEEVKRLLDEVLLMAKMYGVEVLK